MVLLLVPIHLITTAYQSTDLSKTMCRLGAVKWGCCLTGDVNHAKGKEGYPTFAYQSITFFNRQIIGIYGPTFGSRNDKDIVKTDPNVRKVGQGFMKRCYWQYYTEDGTVMYLICDNGYLTWPTTICPHAHFDSTRF